MLLHSAFDVVRSNLSQRKLLLKAEKPEVMLSSDGKQPPTDYVMLCYDYVTTKLSSARGVHIQLVNTYKRRARHTDGNSVFSLP